ncbi:cereblon family protein [Desulfovermiculus halophilus]|uniref:cereblon family protein n=1 Tax=Desulfovermiculus halophilus TaxID=339722 RepID=UPI0012946A6F|nr:cereblon family protein [Desulfovermiculus halophilus]
MSEDRSGSGEQALSRDMQPVIPGSYAFFRSDGSRELSEAAQKETLAGEDRGNALVCVLCGQVVTWKGERISVSGKHAHVVFNPAGIVFELGCFRAAPGCVAQGRSSLEFTWFQGYAWQIGLCRQCRAHLGWRYQGGQEGDVFFGLILGRLLEKSP